MFIKYFTLYLHKNNINMKDKIWNDIRIIGNSGKPKWMGGAYTIAFVYSNKGNFILKGYGAEIREYLQNLKGKGYKYIINETLWSTDWAGKKRFRSIWSISTSNTYISSPTPKSKSKDPDKFKWVIKRFDDVVTTMKFKRLPKKWVPDFDKIIY